MELIYETTDKQMKEFQHGLYHKVLKDLGICIYSFLYIRQTVFRVIPLPWCVPDVIQLFQLRLSDKNFKLKDKTER